MAAKKDPQHPKKPRKKSRRLLACMIVLSLIGLAINGPIARWVVLSTLDEQLQTQGMHGQAEISGSLMSGFSFTKISYSGSQAIKSLNIDQLKIDYHLLELFDSKLRNITISKGTTVIDIAKFPENTNTDSAPPSFTETLGLIQLWLSQPLISINQLDVTLLNHDEQQAHITLDALTHEANSPNFNLSGLQVSDRKGQSTPNQDVQLIWKEESLLLNRIEVLPDIALENVELDWKNGLQADAVLFFLQSRLSLKVKDSIQVKLSGDSIDSRDLVKRFKLDLPGFFVLSEADAEILDWQKHPAHWDILGSLKFDAASYENYQLSNTTIKIKQKNKKYSFQLDGLFDSNPFNTQCEGSWLDPNKPHWWAHTEASYTTNAPKLGSLGDLWKARPEGLDLTNTSIKLIGNAKIENKQLTKLTNKVSIQGLIADKVRLPPLSIIADYQPQGKITASVTSEAEGINQGTSKGERSINLNASYDQIHQSYQAELFISEPNSEWINALARVMKSEIAVNGAIQLTWSGSGSTVDLTDLKQRHQGNLEIEKLDLKLPEYPAILANMQLSYDWPHEVSLHSISLQENDWQVMASMQWNGKRIEAKSTQLTRGKELIASLNGSLPYQINIHDAQDFFKQTKPWDLSVSSQPIALKKLREWLGIDLLNRVTGKAKLDFKLSGTPASPEIKGEVEALSVKVLDDQQLSPLDATFNFFSKDQKLIFEGNVVEGKDLRLTTKGSVPFTPSTWIKNPDWIDQYMNNAPVNAEININRLPLTRFQKFIPSIKKITGFVTANARVSGTIKKPAYTLHLDADAPLIQASSPDIGEIRNIKLNAQIDQKQKATTKITAETKGGKFEIKGDINLNNLSKPIFNLTLNTRYALVHRDDRISVRANADLRLKGSIDNTTITGSIGIVESLFYKDLELIPIGVPSSAVATVQLPAISATKAQESLPIPAPFSNWKLDLTVRTEDPILIRGNVATGNITGALKVGGTLANPLPKGTILAKRVKAKLPFSILNIKQGQIIFNGRDGLNPSLKITAKSTVGEYSVTVFIYGPASSPKTTFTSSPPLPESEIMTLLATGTTTSNLENSSVATFKAFQIFLMKLKQRNDKPGGNKLFKAMLTGVEDLNLNVGEVDPFTGRKFASGTVELHPRWHLTAQVDDTQQTRGLIVYVLRFR